MRSGRRHHAGEVNRQLGDLDAIALKALAKEPAKRYQSAGALAEDLRPLLRRKPIEACRPDSPIVCTSWCGVISVVGRYRAAGRGNIAAVGLYHVRETVSRRRSGQRGSEMDQYNETQ